MSKLYSLSPKTNNQIGCRDFEELSLRDYKSLGKTYGLEKFWAFHHYHGFPKNCDLKMNPEVRIMSTTVLWSKLWCGTCFTSMQGSIVRRVFL
jgi:hypothetical protein